MTQRAIDEVPVVALVGRKEAAEMVGVLPENLGRIEGFPRPLQDRRIKGFNVSTGPLYPRSEIEALAERVRVEKGLSKRQQRENAKRMAAVQRERRARAQKARVAKRAKA